MEEATDAGGDGGAGVCHDHDGARVSQKVATAFVAHGRDAVGQRACVGGRRELDLEGGQRVFTGCVQMLDVFHACVPVDQCAERVTAKTPQKPKRRQGKAAFRW